MKKTLNDYLKLPYRMEFVRDGTEGGYVVSFPDLPGCITCGENLTAAAANAGDAKKSVAGSRACRRPFHSRAQWFEKNL